MAIRHRPDVIHTRRSLLPSRVNRFYRQTGGYTDDSYLVRARLLQGIVGKVGEKGGLLKGKEIAESIQREAFGLAGGCGSVGYGVPNGTEGMVLEIGEGMVTRK